LIEFNQVEKGIRIDNKKLNHRKGGGKKYERE